MRQMVRDADDLRRESSNSLATREIFPRGFTEGELRIVRTFVNERLENDG